jgi:hypothetical protein
MMTIVIMITMMFILMAGYRDVALRKFFNFSLELFIRKERFCLVSSRSSETAGCAIFG